MYAEIVRSSDDCQLLMKKKGMKGIESKNCVIVVKRKVTKVLNPKRLIVGIENSVAIRLQKCTETLAVKL